MKTNLISNHHSVMVAEDVHKSRTSLKGLMKLSFALSCILVLCLFIAQIFLYMKYLNLKTEVEAASQILKQYQHNISSLNLYVPEGEMQLINLGKTTEQEEVVIDPFQILNSQNGNRPVVDASHFMPDHSRFKRSDILADSERARKSRRNRRLGNGDGNNQEHEIQKVTTVVHLELKSGLIDPQILQGEKITGWEFSDDQFNRDQDFAEFGQGQITILKSGIYLVYSQVTFVDSSGRWSYAITIQEPYRMEKPFIKCLSTEWGIEPGPDGTRPTTFSQCYTAAVAFMKQGEIVRIKSMYNTDSIHTDTDMSFWGFVKLA